MKKTLITLAALAGLTAFANNAEAEELKEKPKIARKADTTRCGQSILRRKLELNANFAWLDINNFRYEQGPNVGLDLDASYDAAKWLNLRAMLNFNHDFMKLQERNATENISSLNLNLEGRTKLFMSNNLKIKLGLGAEYFFEKDALALDGRKAHATRHLIGPSLGISIESRYLDFYATGSILLGARSSSYDRERDVWMLRTKLTLVPRYWKFELPMSFSSYMQQITEEVTDRRDIRLRFQLKPTFLITPNIGIHINYEFIHNQGTDDYTINRIGGGATIKF
jgi:hypothetical protein